MSRNNPPRLAGWLDLLRKGEALEISRVLAGDMVDDITMDRARLPPGGAAATATIPMRFRVGLRTVRATRH